MAVVAAGHGGRTRRLLGHDPIGYAFVAPYVLFLAGLFVYPLLVAVYISFFDYFFAAPGAIVARPFVGLEQLHAGPERPGLPALDLQRGRVHPHQRPVDGAALAGAGLGAQREAPVPRLLPHRLLHPVRDRQRRGHRRLAVALLQERARQRRPRPAGAQAFMARQRVLGDADHRPHGDLEAARLLRDPLPGRAAEHPARALRGGRGRRRRRRPAVHGDHGAGRAPGDHPGRRSWPRSSGPTCSPSRTC